ncbi:hypothetical protein DFA_12264 [Cavenderia fasciculata]|uniref:Uncharacterized protein n=1 Tax=Cavenderia fasciculata TaxID=261658 RepID=F4QCW5_CACFS|nr:uncharacterized protein DFA_12264 [Cavenderia fasciculata]EGG14489.1 hypothetical protein DFA_12264 [Cavenderia fasciculata]|eukprot:XP_004353898.1 hypothetical protein DFA_12264 [Cavenderia fasciculata]
MIENPSPTCDNEGTNQNVTMESCSDALQAPPGPFVLPTELECDCKKQKAQCQVYLVYQFNRRVDTLHKSLVIDSSRRDMHSKIGDHEIDVVDLNNIREKEKGLCAVSSAYMVDEPLSDCQSSLDRFRDSTNYLQDNIRLVCREFNTNAKWTTDLLRSIGFESEFNQSFADPSFDELKELFISNKVESYLKSLWRNAKENNDKRNGLRTRDLDNPMGFDITVPFLTRLWLFLKARCYYSGIDFEYTPHVIIDQVSKVVKPQPVQPVAESQPVAKIQSINYDDLLDEEISDDQDLSDLSDDEDLSDHAAANRSTSTGQSTSNGQSKDEVITRVKSPNPYKLSIERLDPTLGYLQSNTVLILYCFQSGVTTSYHKNNLVKQQLKAAQDHLDSLLKQPLDSQDPLEIKRLQDIVTRLERMLELREERYQDKKHLLPRVEQPKQVVLGKDLWPELYATKPLPNINPQDLYDSLPASIRNELFSNDDDEMTDV